jgi:hypothetical protein
MSKLYKPTNEYYTLVKDSLAIGLPLFVKNRYGVTVPSNIILELDVRKKPKTYIPEYRARDRFGKLIFTTYTGFNKSQIMLLEQLGIIKLGKEKI